MRDKRCGNCENYALLNGECRAHPPVLVVIQAHGLVVQSTETGWPNVSSVDWCGEFSVIMSITVNE